MPGDVYTIIAYRFSNTDTEKPEFIVLTLADGYICTVTMRRDGYECHGAGANFVGKLQRVAQEGELELDIAVPVRIVSGWVPWGQGSGGRLSIISYA